MTSEEIIEQGLNALGEEAEETRAALESLRIDPNSEAGLQLSRFWAKLTAVSESIESATAAMASDLEREEDAAEELKEDYEGRQELLKAVMSLLDYLDRNSDWREALGLKDGYDGLLLHRLEEELRGVA
jgi:hypothetical protein